MRLYRVLLGSMKIGADRIQQIILLLRNFSRLDESEMKPVDIHDGSDPGNEWQWLMETVEPEDSLT
jgi:signal transduction histidine kinase